MSYSHTQSRPEVPTITLAAAVVAGIAAVVALEPWNFVLAGVLALLAALAFALSTLTTTVTDEMITAEFRSGRPRRVVRSTDVASARVVRSSWWHGWGIRWLPGATMYNVWGLDAVHLELDGQRDFRIGTDDPHGLLAAITHDDSAER